MTCRNTSTISCMAKSKLTKAKEISKETKERVLERQHYRSISGVALTPYNTEFHHVIFRSDSGVGYEFNIVAITSEEHRAFHDHQNILVNGRKRYTYIEFGILMKNHLKLHYSGWEESKCKYHKYWSEDDYKIRRMN